MVKKLKELRNKEGISQQKLANELGISQQSVNKYENHSIEPDISTLIAIADYFDVTLDYLVGRDDIQKSYFETDGISYAGLTEGEQQLVDKLIKTYIENKKNL